VLNKDKRSIALSFILGDGNLFVTKQGYSRLTIDHGLAQYDYQNWKASMLSEIFGRDVKVRSGHKGRSVQVCVSDRRLRAWKKFTYPNNKKDLARILPFIKHPEMAVAIWLMDDGYVESSFSKLADGTKKNYGARFRIFTCDQSEETQHKILAWFKEKFDFDLYIKYSFKRSANKSYPFLKINQTQSLILWDKIRPFVLQFKSMQYKFRYIEQIYQSKFLQPQTRQS
jgi:LAGLIDADG DNA endonuclease family